jgi:hypothetical protein
MRFSTLRRPPLIARIDQKSHNSLHKNDQPFALGKQLIYKWFFPA